MSNPSPTPFLDQLRTGLATCRCAGRLLVAVSGGADSVALLRGLHALAGETGVEPVVAHLDHGLRPDSAADTEWVVALADQLGLDFRLDTIDVARTAADRGIGIEEAARRARYDFLVRSADDNQCTAVAVAHNSDDQVETILHHIVRGTGLTGLRGMPRERTLFHPFLAGREARLVRPLLDVSRSTIEDYLADIEQPFRTDATNGDTAFTRNRIRRELLPLLEESFNPRVREALLRLGSQAAEVVAVVDDLAAELLERSLGDEPDDRDDTERIVLRIAPFGNASDHVARAALVLLWQSLGWPRQNMGAADWQRLLDVLRNGGAVTLPGAIHARRETNGLSLTPSTSGG